jgi:hypothetical protein
VCSFEDDAVTSDGAVDGHIHTDDCYATDKTLVCGVAEHEHTEECYAKDNKTDTSNAVDTLSDEDSSDTVEPMPKDLSDYITNIGVIAVDSVFEDAVESMTGSGLRAFSMFDEADIYINGNSDGKPVTYDAETDSFKTAISMNFNPDRDEITTAPVTTDNGVEYYVFGYDLPVEIINVENSILGTWTEKKDSTGDMINKFRYMVTEKGDGTFYMTVQFYKNYVDSMEIIEDGKIHFEVELGKEAANDEGEIEIKVDGKTWLSVPVEKIDYPDNETADYDITTKKTAGNFDSVTNEITYTVEVSSDKGTPKDIALNDTINLVNNNLIEAVECKQITVEMVEYNVAVNQYGGKTTTTNVINTEQLSTDKFDTSTGELSLTLNKLDGVKYTSDTDYTYIGYVVKYTYAVNIAKNEDGSEQEITANARNDVEVKSSVSDDLDITDTAYVNKTITTVTPDAISKSNGWSSDGETLSWTININGKYANLKDAVLEDSMFGSMKSYTISPSDDNIEQVTDEEGKVTSFKFLENNEKSYSITYTTPITDWEYQSFSNTATLTDGDGKVGTATAGGGSYGGSIAKSCTASGHTSTGELELTWTVDIVVPSGGIPSGNGSDTPNNTNKGQYISVANAREIVNMFASNDGAWKSKIKNLTFTATDGNVYTADDVSSDSFDTNIRFTRFDYDIDKITYDECSGNISFSYKTTVDTSAVSGNEYYNNTVSFAGRSASGYYSYEKNVIKSDEKGNTGTTSLTNEDGKLVWLVKVKLPENCYNLNVTDYLPKEVDLSTIEASVNNGSSSYMQFYPVENGNYKWCALDNNNGFGFTTTVDENNNVSVVVNTGSYTTSTLYLRYTCQLGEAYMPEAGKISAEPAVLANKVSVTVNNSQPYDTAEQTQKLTVDRSSEAEKQILKSVSWEPNNLSYSLKLNPNGEKYGTEDTYQVIDTLSYKNGLKQNWGGTVGYVYLPRSINLDPASVKLYYAKCDGDADDDSNWTKGALVDVDDWAYETDEEIAQGYSGSLYEDVRKLIKLTLPNNGDSFIFEYTYVAEYFSQTAYGDSDSGGVGATNTAEITSVLNAKSEEVKSDDSWSTSSAGGSIGGRKRYVIYKVEKGKNNKYLQGAVYTLFKYEDGQYVATDKVIPPTNENGYTAVDYDDLGLEPNTLYCIMETTPPTGYELPEVPEGLYFYCKDDTKISYLPDSLPDDCVDLSVSQPTKYMENAKTGTTSVKLNKVWLGIGGEQGYTPTETSVLVDLYARYKTLEEVSPNTEYVTITLKDHDGTTRIIRNVPKGKAFCFIVKNNSQNGCHIWVKDNYYDDNISAGQKLSSKQIVANEDMDFEFYNFASVDYDDFDYSLEVVDEGSDDTSATTAGTVLGTKMVGSYEIKADEDWTKVIDNLPKTSVYNQQYAEVEYYVVEQKVDGYSSEVEAEDGNQFKITNTKLEQRFIKLVKHWLDSDGGELQDPGVDAITCELRVKAYTNTDADGDAVSDKLVKEVTLTAPSWNSLVDVTDLPATGTDDSGNTLYYHYYVVEKSVTGFEEKPTYTNNDGINLSDEADVNGVISTVEITNKKLEDDKAYELPSTGGIGTTIYTMAGALLVVCAVCCLYIKTKRNKV